MVIPEPNPTPSAELAVTALTRMPDRTRVTFAGEIDMSSVDRFHDAIAEAFEAHPSGCLDVDLRGVTFMDSSGVNTLAYWWRRTAERGGRLVISHPIPSVRHVLEITGLTGLVVLPGDDGIRSAGPTVPDRRHGA